MKKILGCFFVVLFTALFIGCGTGVQSSGGGRRGGGGGNDPDNPDNPSAKEKTFEQLLAEGKPLVFKGEERNLIIKYGKNDIVKYKYQRKPFTLTIEPASKRASAEMFYVKEDGSPVPQEDFKHLNGSNREVWDGVYKMEDGLFVWEVKKTIVNGGKIYEEENWIYKYECIYKDNVLTLNEKFYLSWDDDAHGYIFKPTKKDEGYTLKRQ